MDGGDDHLSLLDIRRVFFKVCPRAQSSGFRGSRLMELSSFSLSPSSSPYFPFLLVARPDAERNCPSPWLLYTSLCWKGGGDMAAWLFLRFRLDRCKENGFFLAVSCPSAGAWLRPGVISRRVLRLLFGAYPGGGN